MYSIRHLAGVARDGFRDMGPAVRAAFNGSREDDRLDRVFGPRPGLGVAVVIAAGLALGLVLERALAGVPALGFVDLPVVLIAAAYAFAFRNYLFASGEAGDDDFPWLAASLVPAVAVLVVFSFFRRGLGAGAEALAGAPAWTGIGAVLVNAVDALSVAAGLVIAVAALCYSRRWSRALRDLAMQLLVFYVTIWLMVLLFVEIGLVGAVLGKLVESITGIDIPHWLGEFVDQLTYAGLMAVIYLAIVGAAWTVCRRRFGPLLRSGHADIIPAMRALAVSPQQKARRERKRAKRRRGRSSKRG